MLNTNNKSGGVLLSLSGTGLWPVMHRLEACATNTSALPGLTSEFGMGSGVAHFSLYPLFSKDHSGV